MTASDGCCSWFYIQIVPEVKGFFFFTPSALKMISCAIFLFMSWFLFFFYLFSVKTTLLQLQGDSRLNKYELLCLFVLYCQT